MKKSIIVTAAAVAAVSAFAAISVSAATNSDIITQLTNAGLSSTQLAKAQDLLNAKTYTSAELDSISSDISTAITAAKAAGVTDFANITAAQVETLKADSTFAAAVKSAETTAGVTVTVGDNGTVTVGGETFTPASSSSSSASSSTSSTVSNSQTGVSTTMPVAAAAAGVAALAGLVAAAYAKMRKSARQ